MTQRSSVSPKVLPFIAFVFSITFASLGHAAIVQETYRFSAFDFRNTWPSADVPPFRTLSGSFAIDIDTDYPYANDTSVVRLLTLSNGFVLDSALCLTVSTLPIAGVPEYEISLGGYDTGGGSNSLSLHTDDIVLSVIITDPLRPRFDALSYTTEDTGGSYLSETGWVELSSVPLPAALPMMGAALLGLAGFAAARRAKPTGV